MPSPEELKQLKDSGKLDEWLKAGTLKKDRYDFAMKTVADLEAASANDKAAGGSGQMMVRDMGPEEPDDISQPYAPTMNAGAPPSAQTAAQRARAYTTPTELARANNYVPGHGDAPSKDGSWWDDVKNSVPQKARDTLLGMAQGAQGSRGPVYMEPTEEEAEAALIADAEAQGLRPKTSHEHIQRWLDQQWANAYDDAKERGVAIYRGKYIDNESPYFMQVAKRMSEITGPVEAAARQADKTFAAGRIFHQIDTGDMRNTTREMDRQFASEMGMPPPGYLGTLEDDQVAARRNLERGRRMVEAHPVAGAVGSIGGALAPGGVSGALSKVAGKLVAPLATGRGFIGGMAKAGAEAGLAGTAEQLSVNATQRASEEFAGMPPTDLLEGVGITGGVSSILGSAMGMPRGVSRGLRESNDVVASSHRVLEEGTDRASTSLRTSSGLNPPVGHEEMLAKYPIHGSYAGAKTEAAEAAANVMEAQSKPTVDLLEQTSQGLMEQFEREGMGAHATIGGIAEDVVRRGERSDRLTDEQAMRFTKRLMDKMESKRLADEAQMQVDSGLALKKEGAPAYPDVPGPNAHISDLEARAYNAEQSDYGLNTEYPSVSAAPIIDKHFELLNRISFNDGAAMPTSTHAKLKASVDSLFRKKTIDAGEEELYADVAYDMMKNDDGTITVTLPRLMSARELDDLIQNFDEMAKYSSNSASPDAARYKELGAVSRQIRETGFETLAASKAGQHELITETEEMLRSVGLAKNVGEINPGSVDQATTVLENVKRIAASYDLRSPEGLAIPRKQFERWLSKYDEELFDQYMHLRDLSTQQKNIKSYDITVANTPRSRSESFEKVVSAITGKRSDVDALMGSFRSIRETVEAARRQLTKVSDIYTMLGADKSMGSMTAVDRMKMRTKLYQVLLHGGDEFNELRKLAKPEQQLQLDTARQAAHDTDSMFRTLGFGPTHNKPGFDGITRDRVVRGLEDTFHNYKRFGESLDFDRSVDQIFKDTPEVKTALLRMTKERAYQFLANDYKGNTSALLGIDRPRTFMTSTKDFFENHIDAMVRREPRKYSPIDAPSQYAVGLASPGIPGDTNREPEAENISAAVALKALIRAVSRAQKENNK